MPETFFGLTMRSPWFYSLLYNLAYMLPNIAITLVVFAIAYVVALCLYGRKRGAAVKLKMNK